jgi:glycosyltransferase involved in cell wall biosynthesis
MRVLMTIRDDAQTSLGGDTIQMLKTKAALEAQGVRVDMRCVSEIGDAAGYDLAHVFNIQTAESSWAAFEALEKRGFPIVLSSIYWDMLDHWFEFAIDQKAMWRILAQTLGKVPTRDVYVRWQRAKAPRTPVWRLQQRMLERAVRVLPNSQSEAELLQATFRLNGAFYGRVQVVPNGIDTALFDPAPEPSRWFVDQYGVRDFVLEVGAVSPVKNQIGLIEALYDLPVPIVIVGQPAPALPEYAEQCKAIGARRGNVIFIDRLPHEELPGIYALAAVHALPSWRETPGLASLEAAAAGCRIATTSIGSTGDYFGDFAHYCHPDDRQSIRSAVEAALRQPRTSDLREHVLRNYSWQRAGEATLQAYQAALS